MKLNFKNLIIYRFARFLPVLFAFVLVSNAQESEGDLFFYLIKDLKSDRIIDRGSTDSRGIPANQLILAPNTDYRLWMYHVNSNQLGYSDFRTRPSGRTFELPTVTLQPPLTPDYDSDGLPDEAEFIIGTKPKEADSDGDGILDLAEIQQGLDPDENAEGKIGIISPADTPGTAVDVAAFNDLVIVADSDRGISLFNVFNRMNPVIIAQVDTPGTATRVAFSGNLVAVADGNAGLAIIDISDPPVSRITFQIPPVLLGGSATAVTTSGGIAYVGTDRGKITSVDLQSGIVLEQARPGGIVYDLAIEKDVLFAISSSTLFAYFITTDNFDFSVFPEELQQISVSGFGPEGITNSKRLFVGGGLAYISSFPDCDVVNVSNPRSMAVIVEAQDRGPNSFKQVVVNGSGLGIAAVGTNPREDGSHHISLYDVSDPQELKRPEGLIQTPGTARAVTLFNGLAYVADSAAGLQVINYESFDSAGLPPTLTLEASFPLTETPEGDLRGEVEEGKLVRVTANATDDVQVRNVEFNIDGVRVATDGNFPFEFFFTTPRLQDQLSFRLSARASDTGGNAVLTDEIIVILVEDVTPPRITRVTPRQGATLGRIGALAAFFNEPMDTSTFNSESFSLAEAGPDDLFDTDDDVVISTGTIEWREDTLGVFMNFADGLPPGLYRAQLTAQVTDLAGNALRRNVSWGFRVFDIKDDRDGDGVPDAVEIVLELDPDNPDTDRDGVFDGEEDADDDELTNMQEILLFTDPANPDTDSDGILDGKEDSDTDGLRDIEEFIIHGTGVTEHDTDRDGFNDGEEIEHGSNPLDPGNSPLDDVTAVVGNAISVQNFTNGSFRIGKIFGNNVSVRNNTDPGLPTGEAFGENLSVQNLTDPSPQTGEAHGANVSTLNSASPEAVLRKTGHHTFSVENLAEP